jgi:hypothetical protein
MGVANCAASLAAGTRQAAGSASMNSTGAGGRAGGTVTSGTGG